MRRHWRTGNPSKKLALILFTAGTLVGQQDSATFLGQPSAAYQAGTPAEAEQSLQRALEQHPDDLRALLLMGVILDTEKRFQDAESYYQRAVTVAPTSARVLNNLGNHYLASGDRIRARKAYQQAVAADAHHPNANLQLAQMNVEEGQGRQALANLGRVGGSAAAEAGTLLLRARALALCGRCAEASAVLSRLERSVSDAQAQFSIGMSYAECKSYQSAEQAFSRALAAGAQSFELLYNLALTELRSGHLERAQSTLDQALQLRPGDPDALQALAQLHLQHSVAVFHRAGPAAALAELDKTGPQDRNSDYYLLRAEILDAEGDVPAAAEALNASLRAAPSNVSLYYEAIGFLLKNKLYQEAEIFLEKAAAVRPDDRDLLLAQALTLNLLRRNADSEKLIEKIEARWPEWDRIYLLKGILQEIGLKSAEARRTLEKAIALGAKTPEAYYYEALAITHASPRETAAAQKAVAQALTLTKDDPYIYLLAGRISMAQSDYRAAISNLLQAARLQPALLPAHYELRHAYSALGEVQASQAELDNIRSIAKQTSGTDDSRFAVDDLLFAVRPPR